jgi:tyrosyl-tRNA synthetase
VKQVTEGNPCIEYIEHIVFPWFSKFDLTRNEANGGNKCYTDMAELKADYSSGALHPGWCYVTCYLSKCRF